LKALQSKFYWIDIRVKKSNGASCDSYISSDP
jgi:hypothetical protein